MYKMDPKGTIVFVEFVFFFSFPGPARNSFDCLERSSEQIGSTGNQRGPGLSSSSSACSRWERAES